MDNDISGAVVLGFFAFIMWLIGLVFAFWPTFVVTMFFLIVVAVFMTSGGGDGRTRND